MTWDDVILMVKYARRHKKNIVTYVRRRAFIDTETAIEWVNKVRKQTRVPA